ncbi:MAG: septum site-determining protein minD [Pseudonocardiales bacterium]|nr:MAG: septum site-determining protein minD [Pseudonocardiales bacterium]
MDTVERPLLLTDDPDLLDDLVRLAGAAGVEVEVAAEPGAAWRAWTSAPMVVASAGLGAALRRAGLPRRDNVVLVGQDTADERVWELAQDVGANHVVFLPAAQRWLTDRFAGCLRGGSAPAPIVSVLGGRGGAGASVLAVALALAAARRDRRAVLVDADPLGGGLDLVLGGEDAAGLRWPDLSQTSGRLAGAALCAALPQVADLSLLSWDRGGPVEIPGAAMAAVLGAVRRGADLVVCDLPRSLDEPAVQALRDSDVALLVVPAEVRACAAAARVAVAALAHCTDLRVVVRGPAPAGLASRDVAAALQLPLEGVLRPEPGLAPRLERGAPLGVRGPLAGFCGAFLDRLEQSARAAAAS